MRLVVATPTSTELDAQGVLHVRAEDESGAFGVLPGHADFVTALPVSVVSWRDARGDEHHVAVRGGVLTVAGGEVGIAARQAICEDDLEELERKVRDRFRSAEEEERSARAGTSRLHLAAIRQIRRVLEASRATAASFSAGRGESGPEGAP